ncbi:M20/M25/M40 family metallo-hydrolase [Inquilinus sp. CA228]|uniref:M20/M25/M40 family metallo-hydrolase n=1 Tax=Inquilinus sp. CA228 TaxID=3455609 RepID=UPI003F8D8969
MDTSSKTAALLQKLLQFKTVNPPGDTAAIARFLKQQFEPLGAKIDLVQAPRADGPVHFVARLRGDGSKKPVLLAAHSDVVPVEPDRWSVDPFAGVIRDGYVLGRGAMDFKGGLAVFARAVMMLAENKVPLARDVILLSEGDEESGPHGARWLADQRWDLIEAEFALNEGGWIFRDGRGTARQVNITVRDKNTIVLRLTARGAPTHSAWPGLAPHTAIGRLIIALARLVAREPQPMMTELTQGYFAALSRTTEPPLAGWFHTLATSPDAAAREAAGRRIVEEGAYPMLWHALMRNTLAITMLNGGIKENVIPGSAEAKLNIRLLPGQGLDEAMAYVREVIADDGIRIDAPAFASLDEARADLHVRTNRPASSTETALYRSLKAHAERIWPEAEVTPALFEAGTDATAWRLRGVPVYGVYPYPLDNETMVRMHGNDERIEIAALDQGTDWVYSVLVDVAGRS